MRKNTCQFKMCLVAEEVLDPKRDWFHSTPSCSHHEEKPNVHLERTPGDVTLILAMAGLA